MKARYDLIERINMKIEEINSDIEWALDGEEFEKARKLGEEKNRLIELHAKLS